MSNSIDFRADQIQTKQIIVKNTSPDQSRLLIYGIEAEGTPVNEGVINTTHFPQNGIGTDVFLFVSGAVNTKGSATERGTSVFGGDVVVSGSLYQGSARIKGGNYSFAHGNSVEARGNYSHAEGRETTAIGSASHAEGYGGAGYASGDYSHAEGQATIAYGAASHAEGFQTNASGDYCHAEGQDTYVTTAGDYSHAEGHLTKVDNRYAHTEGYGTLTNGLYSHAEGYLTTGSGEASHAEGKNTTAAGNGSHTEGYFTKTESTGIYCHAEGYLTTASAYASHAEGQNTTAAGNGSHTEGYFTKTEGSYSHAQGSGSIAWGIYSFAAGNKTIASGSVDVTQAAFGRFNKRDNTTSLFVIGNGTGDSNALRGDIFRAESTGELVLSGAIKHAAKYWAGYVGFAQIMSRSDYLWIVATSGGANIVYLPMITDSVADIGLTVKIRQNDGIASGNTLVIYVNSSNSGYTINGFDTAAGTLTLGTGITGTSTNRSVTLTFMGIIGGLGRWFVVETSTC